MLNLTGGCDRNSAPDFSTTAKAQIPNIIPKKVFSVMFSEDKLVGPSFYHPLVFCIQKDVLMLIVWACFAPIPDFTHSHVSSTRNRMGSLGEWDFQVTGKI